MCIQFYVKHVTLENATSQPPRLLDQLRRYIRANHYSLRTERVYVYWARWYIRFHGLRHPKEMGVREIQLFMPYLVNERKVADATYAEALCALLFLYKKTFNIDVPWIDDDDLFARTQQGRPWRHFTD
jgi:tRNA A22 N-methylase